MSEQRKPPLAGRLLGWVVVLLLAAIAARVVWDVLAPLWPSLSGLLVIALLARQLARRKFW